MFKLITKDFGPGFHSKYPLKTKLPLISRSQHFKLWENVVVNLSYAYIKITSVSRSKSWTACVDFQSGTLSKSKHPLISDMHLLTLRSLYNHSGGINGIATILSKGKVNTESYYGAVQWWHMQGATEANIPVLWPHNGTHIWSAKQQVTMKEIPCASWSKFTNSGLTVAAFCQVTSGISLLERGLWKYVKEEEWFRAMYQTS